MFSLMMQFLSLNIVFETFWSSWTENSGNVFFFVAWHEEIKRMDFLIRCVRRLYPDNHSDRSPSRYKDGPDQLNYWWDKICDFLQDQLKVHQETTAHTSVQTEDKWRRYFSPQGKKIWRENRMKTVRMKTGDFLRASCQPTAASRVHLRR